jgi:FtsP/CotA-like multicopper oxidase with cupredoxin domain
MSVPWAMDGAAWMQDPVGPGESFRYEFDVTESGTFWYHPHFDSEHQLDLGLYGAIVVEDPAEPAVDAELVAVLDAWGEEQDHDSMDLAWTVNGLADPVWRPASGGTARVRILDVSNTGYALVTWPAMRQIASDQGLLATVESPLEVLLGPGDRAEFEMPLGPDNVSIMSKSYSLDGGATHEEPIELFDVEPSGDAAAPADLAWPVSARPPSEDPPWTDITYVFQGSDETDVWLINGEVYPDVTVESVALGERTTLEVRNASGAEHPFHLHGHAFELLSRNGIPVETFTYEDTVNVPVQGWVRLALDPTNPGEWMAHCHILPHAEGGMMTVLRVE